MGQSYTVTFVLRAPGDNDPLGPTHFCDGIANGETLVFGCGVGGSQAMAMMDTAVRYIDLVARGLIKPDANGDAQ